MLVVIPYFKGDQAMALKLSKWMLELGGCKGHRVLIARDYRTDQTVDTEIHAVLSKTFDSVNTLTITGDVWNTWRISPQHMFKETARYIEYKIKEPWLWFEVDAVPLCKGWLDIVHKEYYPPPKGKPFWGAFVPGIHGAPDHLSGIAVYPGELVEHAGNYYFAHDTPFDLMGADQAVPKARFSDRVQHKWQRTWVNEGEVKASDEPPFKDYEDFRSNVTTEAVIFHADKTLSLIDILRPVLFPNKDWKKEHEFDAGPVPIGGTGIHGIKCTCVEKEFPFPCLFHAWDNSPNGQPNSSGSRPSGVSVSYKESPMTKDNTVMNCTYSLSPEPKEGTINNGFKWSNGAWRIIDPKDLAAGNSQMGVEEPPSALTKLGQESSRQGRTSGVSVVDAGNTQNLAMSDVKRSAELLGAYAKQNGFALMRVRKELKAAGLLPKKEPNELRNNKSNKPKVKRGRRRRVPVARSV